MSENIYIGFPMIKEVNKRKVSLSDVASIYCKDNHIEARVKALTLININEGACKRVTFSAIKVIEIIKDEIDNVEITNIGENEFIVFFNEKRKENPVFSWMKVIFLSVVILFGGAFAMMAYGNDIDIGKLFDKMSEFCGVENSRGAFWLKITYSVGLTIGVLIFYNLLGFKRMKSEPSALEVEMRDFEEKINKAIIEGSDRKDKTEDVD